MGIASYLQTWNFVFYPYKAENHSLLVAIDALHPNNNSESVNVGAQYSLSVPSYGDVFVRGRLQRIVYVGIAIWFILWFRFEH